MSLFDSASLVVTPNGYKAGKLYSIKPTSGAGDLDVTRATSATRVNASGLIEIPRTNLLLRSEEFDNASWVKSNATISANTTTAPDGTLTADKLVENANNSTHIAFQTVNVVSNTIFTYSIFVKAAERNIIYLGGLGRTPNSNEGYVWFDLNLGTVLSSVGGFTGSIQPLNNGWWKISVTTVASPTSTQREFRVGCSTAANIQAYQGDGTSGVFLWGAQLEIGNVATEYIPTTSAIRTRFAGITQDGGSANNIPRLDYTNASCPSILVEPQRTNLLLRSEEFDNASWVKTASTVTANATTSPSGTMTADKLVENNTNASHFMLQSTGSLVVGNTYFVSIYLKAAERNRGRLRVTGVSAIEAEFNLQNGTVSVANAIIQNVGNDWYRIGFPFVANATTMSTVISLSNSTTGNSGFNYTYLGDNTSGVFLWGAQLEVGSNATSYIPTQASTVTRNADVISKTGVSSLIGQTEGTFYLDIAFVNGVASGTGNSQFRIRNTAFTNWIGLTSNTFVNPFRITARATTGSIINYEANITSGKAAVAWSSAGVVLYVNGVQVRTSATNPNFSFDTIDMVGFMTFNAKGSVLFPTRLSNDELAQLTTL